ncbi:MAG: LptF/LptG family permease, partial [Armatimonadota bacterium]
DESTAALEQGREEWAQELIQHYHVRLALPWATVGLAILGVGLGVRRQRSSRGIGMGISLIVIFIYYVVMHTLTLVGERGVAHPALMAWLPNILLYIAGVGFLLRRSR